MHIPPQHQLPAGTHCLNIHYLRLLPATCDGLKSQIVPKLNAIDTFRGLAHMLLIAEIKYYCSPEPITLDAR
jgi:hypothetical protein